MKRATLRRDHFAEPSLGAHELASHLRISTLVGVPGPESAPIAPLDSGVAYN